MSQPRGPRNTPGGENPPIAGEHAGEGVADARFHASEERFHKLVDAVTDYAIFMLDATGHVASWNPGARRTKGYEADEILGKHFSVFYTPEDRAARRPDRILDTVRREGRFEEENWRVRKDGTRFWANVVISALRDPRGEVIGFAKVTRDLTEKRQAEERERSLLREKAAWSASEAERRRLLTLLEHVPAIVNFLRGPELLFEFVHPRTVEASAGRELVGKPVTVAVPAIFDEEQYEQLRHVQRTGEPFVQHEALKWRAVEGGKRETYWNSVYLPVRDATGATEGVMTFELEVTDSVIARRELERVSHANERAREELERLNRAKDEFLATMSHELRTPLNAIYGWASILRKERVDQSKLERGLEVIERNARAQTRLVGDLLDVSRIISGKLQLRLKRTELSPLIHEAADVVRPAAENKGIRLLVDVDPDIGWTLADSDRLHQVLWNLLINAVRFTKRGGRITVNADRTDSGIVIRVRDTGIGISAEHLPHIFERFHQVDSSTTRAHGGLGLGLAIVRHLVESHGGSVQAHSEGLGHGTTFTIYLPIRAVEVDPGGGSERQPEPEPDEGTGLTPAVDLQGVRILAVDDDADSLELLRMVLEGAGATVVTATGGQEALEVLERRGSFDIVISDIGMPEMDGYAFIQRLRARAHGWNVPAIALTAYARADDAERARLAGYQEHLAKPIDQRRLLHAVRSWSPHRTPSA